MLSIWFVIYFLPLLLGGAVGAVALRAVTGHWIWDAP